MFWSEKGLEFGPTPGELAGDRFCETGLCGALWLVSAGLPLLYPNGLPWKDTQSVSTTKSTQPNQNTLNLQSQNILRSQRTYHFNNDSKMDYCSTDMCVYTKHHC